MSEVRNVCGPCALTSFLTLSLTNALQGGLQTQAVLTALHDESKARVDGFSAFLLLKVDKVVCKSRMESGDKVVI